MSSSEHGSVTAFRRVVGAFEDLCPVADIALLAFASGPSRYGIRSLRVTLGQGLPGERMCQGDGWIALRTVGTVNDLNRFLAATTSPADLTLKAAPGQVFALDQLAGGWHHGDAALRPDTVFGKSGARSYLCGSALPLFADPESYRRWASAVASSDEYYDVNAFVEAFAFRARLETASDVRQFWFELEYPLYPSNADWMDTQTVFAFASSCTDLGGLKMKWKDLEGKTGAASVGPIDGGLNAVVPGPPRKLSLMVTWNSRLIMELHRDPPTAAAPTPTHIVDAPIAAPDIEEPYAEDPLRRFKTSRLALRRAAKKQLGKTPLYENVVRDLDDALANLDQGRHKPCAILCGGIIEAILTARLTNETEPNIRTAFAQTYPTSPFRGLSDLTLSQLIGVATKLGLLKHNKIYDTVREWRNLVHPSVELAGGSVGTDEAEIAFRAALMLLLHRA